MRTVITTHARERYFERTRTEYKHITECFVPNCTTCAELVLDAQEAIFGHEDKIDQEIFDNLATATEEKSTVNNTNFMQWYYNKYGYEHVPHFFVHKDIVFIVIFKKGSKIIVTCVPSKTHPAGKSAKRKKFKKNNVNCPTCGNDTLCLEHTP